MYRLVGYEDQHKHEKFSQDKTIVRTYIPNHADDIVAVTDEQYVVLKLRYPDIKTLGFYSFPLDYFD